MVAVHQPLDLQETSHGREDSPVIAIAERIHALIRLPLPRLRSRKGSVFWSVKVCHLGHSTTRVDGDLAALLTSLIPPVRSESSCSIGGAAVAPHDIGLIVVGQDLHLWDHDVCNKVVDGEAAGVRLFQSGIRVASDDAGPGGRAVCGKLRVAVGVQSSD
jgi:hypothetical protein